MEEVEIPRYQDSQTQLFFWEVDEFVISVGLFGVGIITDNLTISLIAMYLVSSGLRQVKSTSLEGALKHLLFWFGVIGLNKMPFDGSRREKWV
jgi:conjugal transfer pilus assembly protein TraL